MRTRLPVLWVWYTSVESATRLTDFLAYLYKGEKACLTVTLLLQVAN